MFGYLAKSDANTRYETNEFDTSVDDDTMLIGDPDHKNSRKPRTKTLDNSVFSQCLNPLFCTFLMMILLFRIESKESMQSGNRC